MPQTIDQRKMLAAYVGRREDTASQNSTDERAATDLFNALHRESNQELETGRQAVAEWIIVFFCALSVIGYLVLAHGWLML